MSWNDPLTPKCLLTGGCTDPAALHCECIERKLCLGLAHAATNTGAGHAKCGNDSALHMRLKDKHCSGVVGFPDGRSKLVCLLPLRMVALSDEMVKKLWKM